MKKTVITILVSILVTTAIGLTLLEFQAQKDQLQADQLERIDSKILNEQRKLLVHLPHNYDETKAYPVLYVLDGTSLDHTLANISRVMHNAKITPELILVGIPNTNRNRDQTPPYILEETGGSAYGEGNQFLSFLTNEVIPHIRTKYSTSAYQMLAGHSRAGLFVMYAFLEKPELFDAYFSFSPAFWRDDTRILSEIQKFNSDQIRHSPFLYLSMGTEENQKMKNAYDQVTPFLEGLSTDHFTFVHDYTLGANHNNNSYFSAPVGFKFWADAYRRR